MAKKKKLTVVQRAVVILDKAKERAKTFSGRTRVECIELHFAGYAEPGYKDPSCGIIATGNWNSDPAYVSPEERGKIEIEDAACWAGSELEKLGVELEWDDEWRECDSCFKLVRISADSYGWQRSYVIDENSGDYTCLNCVDPVDYLKGLEGNDNHCNTLREINPASHGYFLAKGEFEHGFHHGQDANPKVIGTTLRGMGITRYLFNLDSVGQFDINFSVWVHVSQKKKLKADALKSKANTDGPSVSEGLRKGLAEVVKQQAALPKNTGDIVYSKVSSDGTAKTRLVPPDEFVKGIKDKG